MGSNTCPLCGEGEVVFFNTPDGPDYDAWCGCTNCRLVFDVDHDERFSTAMDAERELTELREAVRWLLEVQDLADHLAIYGDYVPMWMLDVLLAARAAVDALVGGE